MQETRHPNPQVDPRQPRAGAGVGTNPPVFAWKPAPGQTGFRLCVACDPDLRTPVLDLDALNVPYYLPDKALPPGIYYWTWSVAGDAAPVLSFRIAPESTVLEVPQVPELLRLLPPTHPRIQVRPEQVAALRRSRTGTRAALWTQLEGVARELLTQAHELAEPPFLADYHTAHEQWLRGYQKAMYDSRWFLAGAEILALAYLFSGDPQYGRAACVRLNSVCGWDPAGSTWIEHNDEPHMSLVNWGPYACDWVWDLFTPVEQEAVVAQFRRRGELAIRFMESFGHFGVTHFGSHHGREIAFLGTLCLTFHDRIPETRQWLEWLRPVLCGLWPVWAGDDGAWAEGPHYSTAYVAVMMRFAAALRTGTGIDLFRRPFWRGHLEWRRHCIPAAAEWIGFGDGCKYAGQDFFSAHLIRLISHFTGTGGMDDYCRLLDPGNALAAGKLDLFYLFPLLALENPAAAVCGTGGEPAGALPLRSRQELCQPLRASRSSPPAAPGRSLTRCVFPALPSATVTAEPVTVVMPSGVPPEPPCVSGASTRCHGTTPTDAQGQSVSCLRVFPHAGWAAVHTELAVPERDVCLVLRSSPFGSVSHSHADNNDFALHIGGKSMLIPGGVYDGWETNHHAHYVWHTKSANCITLSDAGQIMRSPEATGAVDAAFEDERVAYFRGVADASYRDRTRRCRRHVFLLKAHTAFLLIDELEVLPGMPSALQWNAHAWSPLVLNHEVPGFTVTRGEARLDAHMLWHAQGFFDVSDTMDPPPLADGYNAQQYPEYHLRYTPWGLVTAQRNLGVLLCVGHGDLKPAAVRAAREDGVEVARLGADTIRVRPGVVTPSVGEAGPAWGDLELGGVGYTITDGGLVCHAVAPIA